MNSYKTPSVFGDNNSCYRVEAVQKENDVSFLKNKKVFLANSLEIFIHVQGRFLLVLGDDEMFLSIPSIVWTSQLFQIVSCS